MIKENNFSNLFEMNNVTVLYEGYSHIKNEFQSTANCSCTLVKSGSNNIIIDTMTPWDSHKILNGLQEHGLTPQDINYVVSSHGHSDHIGNNNLFLKAQHIVGFNISFKDTYYFHPFDKGIGFKIGDHVEVIPTPGHTLSDVTVIVKEPNEVVAITGDLFERFEDIADPTIWQNAGSENELLQKNNRLKVAKMADWIIPGHGPKFRVTNTIIETLQNQVD